MILTDLSRAEWRKSSYSGQNGNCVEVANDPTVGHVLVRDTKDCPGVVLDIPADAWRRLTRALK
jgi:hypothetical protein